MMMMMMMMMERVQTLAAEGAPTKTATEER
jgi:hypothetical protein